MKRKQTEETSSNQLLKILRAASNHQDSHAIENAINMINEGGKDLLLNFVDPDPYPSPCDLHLLIHVMHMGVPMDIMHKIIDIGGKEFLLKDYGCRHDCFTPLHYVFGDLEGEWYQLLPKLLEVGGRDLVMKKTDTDGMTALHVACDEVRSREYHDEAMAKLIEFGGKELVMATDINHRTALYYAERESISLEIIKLMIDIGGTDLLGFRAYYGRLAVHQVAFTDDRHYSDIHETLKLLIKEGINHNVDGEFALGGLLLGVPDNDEFWCNELHEDIFIDWIWDIRIFPVLLEVLKLINKTPPLLHSMIMIEAPKHILLDVLDNDFYGFVSIKDSLGRYAFDVAIEMDLAFHEGLKEILEATVEANDFEILHFAAHHGLPWNNGMEELVLKDLDYALKIVNRKTDLKLFMTAAIGGDLDTIYSLVRMDPVKLTVYERYVLCYC